MSFVLPPEATEPEFTELLAYWQRKSPPGRLPGRQHVDPLELPARILPNILLMAVERGDGQPRFRFRLAGTAIIELIGRELTGFCYDEVVPPERGQELTGAMIEIVHTREPVYLASQVTLPSRDFLRVKRFGVPLASDGETVDMILGAYLLDRSRSAASKGAAASGTALQT